MLFIAWGKSKKPGKRAKTPKRFLTAEKIYRIEQFRLFQGEKLQYAFEKLPDTAELLKDIRTVEKEIATRNKQKENRKPVSETRAWQKEYKNKVRQHIRMEIQWTQRFRDFAKGKGTYQSFFDSVERRIQELKQN